LFLFFTLALNSEVLHSKKSPVCLVVAKHFSCEKINNSPVTSYYTSMWHASWSVSKLSTDLGRISHISCTILPFLLHMRSCDALIYPQSKYFHVSIFYLILKSGAGPPCSVYQSFKADKIYSFKISGIENIGTPEPSKPPLPMPL